MYRGIEIARDMERLASLFIEGARRDLRSPTCWTRCVCTAITQRWRDRGGISGMGAGSAVWHRVGGIRIASDSTTARIINCQP